MSSKAAAHQAMVADLMNDYHLLSFDSLDSTNEEAKRLAKSGGSHGAVIWAKTQTAGKGRMGRSWVSPEGNLFVSVLLKPGKPLEEVGQLSFVASLALAESLEGMVPRGEAAVQCKWPNDVLLNERKVGGILLESFQVGESTQPWVVVGVGVNVEHFPEGTEFPATCIKEAGVELVSAKIVLSRFIHHFIERYNQWQSRGFVGIRRAWTAHAWGLEQKLIARLPTGEVEGTCLGIDTHGALQLKLAGGKKYLVQAGDVFPAEMVYS